MEGRTVHLKWKMLMITEPVGAVSLAIWIYLVFGRGGFWQLRNHHQSPLPEQAGPDPSVAVIVPARNEAEVVGHARPLVACAEILWQDALISCR